MRSSSLKRTVFTAAAAAAVLAGAGGAALADDAAPKVEDRVSAVFNLDYNSHFISYGADVWGAGREWGDTAGTFNPSAQVTLDFAPVSFIMGSWWDVNDNIPSAIGGTLQEVDVWFGVGFNIDKFAIGVLYQAWMYGGDTENILDVSVGYDDKDLLIKGFAFNPSVTFHNRLDTGAAAGDEGLVVVLGIKPSFTVFDTTKFPVTLSVPLNVGIFADDDFHGGTDSGFGFFNVGLGVSVPLTALIPEAYGAWEFHTGLTYWITDDQVIPGNPDDDFITGNVGLSVKF